MVKNIELKIEPELIANTDYIKKQAAKAKNLSIDNIGEIEYIRRSLDCRSKNPKYLLNLNIYSKDDKPIPENYNKRYKECSASSRSVHIIGAGPAGYFAALELLSYGIRPIVYERGKDVRNRRFDLKSLMLKGIVNPDSNYCYGEGGAGTFSDGKLYTRSLKRGNVRKILKIFVEHGAEEDIMVDAQAHIGSDKLPKIIQNIRETIVKYGGEVNFNSKLTNLFIKHNQISEIEINNTDIIKVQNLILAAGHSSKDIYYMLSENNIAVESKDFAVGFRIEHYQGHINEIQYGQKYAKVLPPASYKLVAQVNGKGVYSFCMCPGGIIVPSSTTQNELVVNGMSMSRRNSKFANSGIVFTINQSDLVKYSKYRELAGMKFQEELEKRFYSGNKDNYMQAPAQRTTDFVNNKNSSGLSQSSYIPGLESKNLYILFPENISEALRLGLLEFDKKMPGFLTADSNIIGLESRTSSPVRIPRNRDNMHHINIVNLFPAGEGAGYAGGIVSSAIDGENAAKAIVAKFL